ncbi:MAG: dynamin family protein [Thermoanaerobaculia bacterium]|nr:dynamin family protein [Thermoanaerobaculia bacterium]
MTEYLENVVSPEARTLLQEERDILVSLRETLEEEQSEERRRIDDLLDGLDELFTIVIVGEFNAGKSSLINALFGSELRKEGPVPVDDQISLLRWGESAKTREVSDFIVEESYPVELLRTVRIVDTPGTNSIVRRHQEITEDFIPRADLVLFVTSIDRPLSESERSFLEFIRDWRKKVVFVLNKIDTKSDEEIDEVVGYLRENIRSLFNLDATIFPVSSKLAVDSKTGKTGPRDWTRSRFEALEDYMVQTLSEGERVRLKLLAPIDTVLAILDRQVSMIESRSAILDSDIRKIEAIREHLDAASEDLKSNFDRFTTRIDNLILELERRGVDFLDRYVRINHIMLLRDAARFREEFRRQVFHDWEGSIDRTIQESVDWLVTQNMKLWDSTVDAFQRKSEFEAAPAELADVAGKRFAYNREQVYGRIKVEAERRIQSYDVATESRHVIDDAVRGVVQSLGLGAGAIGLGYLVSTFVTSAAIDVTGLTAATMLLVSSFLVLPYKRSKAKSEFRDKIERLREQMHEALERQSRIEIDRMIENIAESFDPYSRFFRTEMDKIERLSSRLKTIDGRARQLAQRIEELEE